METNCTDNYAIEGFNYLEDCRICMVKSTQVCKIFGDEREAAKMMMALASVEVNEDDGLPQIICESCHRQLGESYEFKRRVEQSDLRFRELLSMKSEKDSLAVDKIISEAINNEDIGLTKCEIKEIESLEHFEELPPVGEQLDSVKDEQLPEIQKETRVKISRKKCPHCIKTFSSKISLERHISIHLGKLKLRFSTSAVERVKSRQKDRTKVTITDEAAENSTETRKSKRSLKYSCKICLKKFTYRKSYVSHAKTHEEYKSEAEEEEQPKNDLSQEQTDEEENELPRRSLQCSQCGKLFKNKRNLTRHISTHSNIKFNCSHCDKEFSRADKLKEHENSRHKKEIYGVSDDDLEEKRKRPHQCSMCPKAFAQPQSLANHMERHQRVKDTHKRFLCEVCSKCFAQSGSLIAHMRTHTGVKPYVCKICSRAFTKSTYLQLHLRTHSGEKPYICQYCSTAFARANTLARHITMHTGEAKYSCPVCFKSFRRLTTLNEHSYTHTGLRPYVCKICGKSYNNAGSLYAHTKKCKAQQEAQSNDQGSFAQMEPNQMEGDSENMVIYTQRKLLDEATVGQIQPSPQFMVANVQKPPVTTLLQTFAQDDHNVYTKLNAKTNNSYFTIYTNM